jgi:hypothetical protein
MLTEVVPPPAPAAELLADWEDEAEAPALLEALEDEVELLELDPQPARTTSARSGRRRRRIGGSLPVRPEAAP